MTGSSESAPVLPVILVALTSVASWLLWLSSRAAGAGSTIEIHSSSIIGWVLGGVICAVLLSWFRSVDLARRSSPTYVEQTWKPALIAGLFTLAGWFSGIAHAWLIASAVARR